MGNPFAPPPPGARPSDPERRIDAGRTDLQQSPPQPPKPPDPPEPVDPALASESRRHVMRFALLMLATLLTSTLPLPTRMLSIGVAVVALVVGVGALRTVRRARIRGTLVVVLSAGLIMTLLVGLSTLLLTSVWDVEMERQTCEARAITNSARLDCQVAYDTGLTERQDELRP